MKLKVTDISYSGSGVAKENGKVIFLPCVDIGEEVEVKIEKSMSKFDIGKVIKVVKASPFRISPPCPYYGECGGCSFQHLTYERELELKRIILKNELKKVGFVGDIAIEPSECDYNYRNKIKLTYCNKELGYISSTSHKFIKIENCLLADKEILKAVRVVEDYLKKHSYSNLKSVTFKSFDSGVMVIFLFTKREKFLYDKLLDRYPIFIAVGDILESNKTKIYKEYNKTIAKYEILGEVFDVDAKTFLQVNKYVTEKLYKYVIENVDGKVVINAYSGQGLLSRLLAKKAQKVIGIEVQSSAHRIAEMIKTDNMQNFNAKVEDIIYSISKGVDGIVLDPAREGCNAKVLEEITKSNIKNIIYISCNFSTLTRDLKLLTKFYKILKIKCFDMFSRTANIETCVVLEKF